MHWVQVDPVDDQDGIQTESKSFILIVKGDHDRHGAAIKFQVIDKNEKIKEGTVDICRGASIILGLKRTIQHEDKGKLKILAINDK